MDQSGRNMLIIEISDRRTDIEMRESSYKVRNTNIPHSGVLTYRTISDRLFTTKQPRELDFMGKTVFTGFYFSESRKVKELCVKIYGAKKMKDSLICPDESGLPHEFPFSRLSSIDKTFAVSSVYEYTQIPHDDSPMSQWRGIG